jgi:U6 snRNA-associated Sm-like protein LSm6
MDESTPPLPDIDAYPPPPPPSAPTGTPTDFLKGVVGKKVIVRLTSGVDYRGILSLSLLEPSLLMYVCMFVFLLFAGVLSCLDGYMNIALEQTEEHVNSVVTNQYGDALY